MFKQFACVALFAGVVSSGYAQFPNDVGAEIAGEFTKYKAKKGAAQVQVTAIATYFTPFMDAKLIKKAKASGTLSFYVSKDKKLSPDDRFVTSKKLKLKAYIPRFIKVKGTLTAEDKGNYLLCVTESPQDEYMANNVMGSWIPFDAF